MKSINMYIWAIRVLNRYGNNTRGLYKTERNKIIKLRERN